MKHRPPQIPKNALRHLLQHAAGTPYLALSVVVIGILFLLSMHLFFHGVFVFLHEEFHHGRRWLWVLVIFPVLLTVLWFSIRSQRRLLDLRVETEVPNPRRVLILFLSPGARDRERIESLDSLDVTDREQRALLQGPWRMPLEAIAHHLGRLEQIVLLPSDQTWEDVPLFRSLCSKAGIALPVVVKNLDEILGETYQPKPKISLRKHPSPPSGVDYHDVEAMGNLLQDVMVAIETSGFQKDDIIIDVTSGLATCSISGVLIAHGREQEFQYVSTRDFKVRSYRVKLESVVESASVEH